MGWQIGFPKLCPSVERFGPKWNYKSVSSSVWSDRQLRGPVGAHFHPTTILQVDSFSGIRFLNDPYKCNNHKLIKAHHNILYYIFAFRPNNSVFYWFYIERAMNKISLILTFFFFWLFLFFFFIFFFRFWLFLLLFLFFIFLRFIKLK